MTDSDAQSESAKDDTAALVPLVVRSGIGGVLMGLANLVPGISGGTMLLAAGVYPRFIQAIAQITTLRFRLRSMVLLGTIVVSAAAIALFAGPVKGLVVHQRWVMFSLFIGLTLGGVPVVWSLIGRRGRSVWIGAAVGFAAMGLLAWVQQQGTGAGGGGEGTFVLLLLAGVAGAGAMILPGVSGGYVLLVLGQYVTILAGIEEFVHALKEGDTGAAMSPAVTIVLPVGIGVVIGVIGVSNLLRLLLARYRKPTLGVLLGFLLGAVVGLWPFLQPRLPLVGEMIKGEPVTAENVATIDTADWPTEYFSPTAGQIGAAVILVMAGFAATALIARLGHGRDDVDDEMRSRKRL